MGGRRNNNRRVVVSELVSELASKLLIAFALLIFIAALGIMGLYCYNNWDEILLELQ